MMRRLFFLLVLMAPMGPLVGQETDTVAIVRVTESEDHVYSRVEQMPEFPGGVEALQSYIRSNLRLPASYLRAQRGHSSAQAARAPTLAKAPK